MDKGGAHYVGSTPDSYRLKTLIYKDSPILLSPPGVSSTHTRHSKLFLLVDSKVILLLPDVPVQTLSQAFKPIAHGILEAD